MKVRIDFTPILVSFVCKLLLPMWIGREYCYESIFAVIFPRHQVQDDGSEEEYVNEELDPPPKGTSVKEEVESSDEEDYVYDEEDYVCDDIIPPKKVHCSVD